jgi:hypothetical protein
MTDLSKNQALTYTSGRLRYSCQSTPSQVEQNCESTAPRVRLGRVRLSKRVGLAWRYDVVTAFGACVLRFLSMGMHRPKIRFLSCATSLLLISESAMIPGVACSEG